MATLRDLLNRARWRDGGAPRARGCTCSIEARPTIAVSFRATRITAVRANGIERSPEGDDEDPVFVPYHRFLAITAAGGARALVEGPRFDGANPADRSRHRRGKDRRRRSPPPATRSSPGSGSSFGKPRPMNRWSSTEVRARAAVRFSGLHSPLDGDGHSFVLERIRAGRKKPGLMRQHLTCVNAAALICNAEVEGATLGSPQRSSFVGADRLGRSPRSRLLGSAGPISLVLQTLALPLALAPSSPGPAHHGARRHARAVVTAVSLSSIERGFRSCVVRARASSSASLPRLLSSGRRRGRDDSLALWPFGATASR